MNASRLYRAALLASLLLFSGCIQKEVRGDVMVWTYEWWVSVVGILGGIVLSVACFLLRKKWANAWIVMVVALLFTVVAGPMGFLNYVELSADHLAIRSGTWIAPTVQNIRFDDVASIDLTKEIKRGRRGRTTTKYYLTFKTKDGGHEKVSVGDEMMEAANDDLATTLKAKGLSVNDMTGE